MRSGPFTRDEKISGKGEMNPAIPADAKTVKAAYYWPMQSHASMGPSCAVADMRADGATVWTASQASHRLRASSARFFSLPAEKIRVVYLDGAGCYGMNGHDDAAADAALLSRAVGRPVRVQWMREDEHGWDPKGPPQLLEISGSIDAEGKILDWRTEMWIPEATREPAERSVARPERRRYRAADGPLHRPDQPERRAALRRAELQSVVAHWLKDAPLRTSNLRAPGKIANSSR